MLRVAAVIERGPLALFRGAPYSETALHHQLFAAPAILVLPFLNLLEQGRQGVVRDLPGARRVSDRGIRDFIPQQALVTGRHPERALDRFGLPPDIVSDVDIPGPDHDLVARKTDQALDVVLVGILRVLEHDHVAPLGPCEIVGKFADQDLVPRRLVADEGWLHGFRRDLECLDDEVSEDEGQDQGNPEGLAPFADHVARVRVRLTPRTRGGPGFRLGSGHYSSSGARTARNASCGTVTPPMLFIRFLPSFCFSKSFRLRVISPP